jgi:hypothetical protein
MFAAWVLALCACAVSPAAAPMTGVERQRLVAHMEMTAKWLADEVSGLTNAQIAFQPERDEWSIAQVLEHLVVVAPIYWKNLQDALSRPPRGGTAMTDADVLWYGIDRTRPDVAIRSELPPGQLRDVRSALTEYRKHHDRLLQYVRTTQDDLRAHIVDRQQCDGYQWALLISTHEQRHILQIREIKAHPGFPK